MATGYNVRVGDAEREATAAQLREHYADGRLTLDELNERLDQTFAAKTRADLNTVMVDLPYSASAGSFGTSAYPGQAVPGPMATRRNWDRPIAIVLFIAALALFRRIFGLGRGRRRTGGPRGPRGPRRPRR